MEGTDGNSNAYGELSWLLIEFIEEFCHISRWTVLHWFLMERFYKQFDFVDLFLFTFAGNLLNHSPTTNQYKYAGQQYVNHGEEDQMEIFGYRRNTTKSLFTWLLIFLSAGFVQLLFFWKPEWKLHMMFSRCTLDVATYVRLHVRHSLHLTKSPSNQFKV